MGDAPFVPKLSRYTFGTMSLGRDVERLGEDVKVARAAMDAGVWFHTSQEYSNGGTFMVLRKAFEETPGRTPQLIVKTRCNHADVLRFDVEDALRRLGVERVALAQLCKSTHEKREVVDDFLAQGPMWRTSRELEEKGLVGAFVMEVFASFSGDAARAVERDLFPGYIFYYNLIERQTSNGLQALLEERRSMLLSLRTMAGGVIDPARAGRLREKSSDDPRLTRLERLRPLFERSGCATWLEFAVRFCLGAPGVETTVAGTRRIEHLEAFVEAAEGAQPLPADVARGIAELHREWSAA
jgi:aryl-alcohol dehydrogenase-like predicted oxidoreductase